MRHLTHSDIAAFGAVYEEDVELISVVRSRSNELEDLAKMLFSSRAVIETQWIQDAGDSDAPCKMLQSYIDNRWLPALCCEISLGAEILGELLGARQVGVRVATLSSPMCPRFHADQIPCRMLMTVSGPGTEWIAHEDVDEALLADRDSQLPPVRSGRKIRRILQGGWTLLKGGTWQEEFGGVIHRSPHQDGQRLLITMDPVFTA
ncbi:MAG: DUF1826 domain-containing protein [Pseudomonadales bacterium]|jgi:hypothetical protein|nr:DUF1826 domain-containing protein [Pseudomonadales bacterium]